ncbi:hypothetical protein [Corynebacterium hadale]|uniref:hypothetical protein n=1 Tax=Corynebacterium hadale TaxID=2026255 RepID=UPI0010558B9D|nr:hypothetical protein [Corynebacterium hadale]
MRKTSSLLASVLLLALPLSACGSGDSDSNASQDASSTTSSRSDEEVIAASQAARSSSSAAKSASSAAAASSSAAAKTEPTTYKAIATDDPQPIGTKCGEIVNAYGERLEVIVVKDGTSCSAGQHVMEEYKADDYGADADRFHNWTSEEGWHCSMDWLLPRELDTHSQGRMTCQDADLLDPSDDPDNTDETSTRGNAARFGEPRHQVVAMYPQEATDAVDEIPR